MAVSRRIIDRKGRFSTAAFGRKQWVPSAKQAIAAKMLHDPGNSQILFHGGSRSGKTESICRFFATRALQFPGSTQIALRKVRRAATYSVWDSLQRHYSHYMDPAVYRMYMDDMVIQHVNGSMIRVDGLDDSARIENILGTEYVTIFLNEATQLSHSFIGLLKTRLAQNVGHVRDQSLQAKTKLIADCNPQHQRHWLYRLCIKGVDPTILNADVELAEDAKWAELFWLPEDNIANLPPGYIETHLDTLPQALRDRYRSGLWLNVEGIVYDVFDEEKHVIPGFMPRAGYTIYRAIDFGYSNPFACVWIAVRDDFKHIVVFDEHYHSRQTINWHAPRIIEKSRAYPEPEGTICDWEAEPRASLEEHGIATMKADKALLDGIERVYRALATNVDGRPLLQVTANCVHTLNEVFSYKWPSKDTLTTSALSNRKDEPVDSNNHAWAAIRYLINHISSELEALDVLKPFLDPISSIDPFLSANAFVVKSETVWNSEFGNEGFGYGLQ